jgi:predicted 3-demethylubiquinone-9 3-methyltransferase (glyoxalase superfamily)
MSLANGNSYNDKLLHASFSLNGMAFMAIDAGDYPGFTYTDCKIVQPAKKILVDMLHIHVMPYKWLVLLNLSCWPSITE